MAESSTITREGCMISKGMRLARRAILYQSFRSLTQKATSNATENAQASMYPPCHSPGGIRLYALPTAPIRKNRAEKTASVHLVSSMRRMSDSVLEHFDRAESAASTFHRCLTAAIYSYGLEVAALATGGAR